MIYSALLFLVFHGLLGGIDVVINHELKERLPDNRAARIEVLLHSLREASFAIIFLGLAWLQWNGIWSYLIAAVVVAEIIITSIDSLVEDRIRTLSPFERLVHIGLFINTGIYTVLLTMVLIDWQAEPSEVLLINHGWLSIALTLLGLFSIVWAVRDAVSYKKLSNSNVMPV